MQLRRLGGSGVRVSAIGLGSNQFGGVVDQSGVHNILSLARELEINFIDTANAYTGGESERLLGRALRGQRDSFLVATKAFFPVGPGPNDRGSSRHHLLRAVEDDENLQVANSRNTNPFINMITFRQRAGRERLDQIVELVGLQERLDEVGGNLSHGETQWLEIGMVLTQDPKLGKPIRVWPLLIMKRAGEWLFEPGRPEWMNAIRSTCFPRWGKISDTSLPLCPRGANSNGDFSSAPTSFVKKPVDLSKPSSSWPWRFVSSGL